MENLAPSLRLILSLRYSLESGRSLNLAIKDYLAVTKDEFATFLLKWIHHYEKGEFLDATPALKSPTQIVLIYLLKSGLEGQSIHSKLVELEREVVERCRNELNSFTHRLSLRLLIPLLLFQFPALLILFLGFLSGQIARNLQ